MSQNADSYTIASQVQNFATFPKTRVVQEPVFKERCDGSGALRTENKNFGFHSCRLQRLLFRPGLPQKIIHAVAQCYEAEIGTVCRTHF